MLPHTAPSRSLAAMGTAALLLAGCSAAPAQPPAAMPAPVAAPVASTSAPAAQTPDAGSSTTSGATTSTATPSATKSATAAVPAKPAGTSTAVASKMPASPAPAKPASPAPAKPSATGTQLNTVNCEVQKCVAITYDDGPSQYTSDVLDILEAENAKATFFLIGEEVEKYPYTARRLARMGMGIGNHTYSHPQMTQLSPSRQRREIERADGVIQDITGVTPRLFRPPFGNLSDTVLNGSRPIVTWDVDTLDWSTHDSDQSYETVMSPEGRGSIILMHDNQRSVVRATRMIVPKLKAKGYTLVTVSQMIGGRGGQVYHTQYD